MDPRYGFHEPQRTGRVLSRERVVKSLFRVVVDLFWFDGVRVLGVEACWGVFGGRSQQRVKRLFPLPRTPLPEGGWVGGLAYAEPD